MDVTDEVCNFMMDGYIEDAVPSIYTVTLSTFLRFLPGKESMGGKIIFKQDHEYNHTLGLFTIKRSWINLYG